MTYFLNCHNYLTSTLFLLPMEVSVKWLGLVLFRPHPICHWTKFFVSDFPINILFISASTKTLFCFATFFLYHCVFQDLLTRKSISLGREARKGLYLLVWDEIPKRLLCSMSNVESSFLWHCRLDHPCLSKFQQILPWITLSRLLVS